ncbi:MAG TPA: O-antigen ligase family protein [Candidatus Udaeobacter sp.]|jgi:O-antigen ligase|nr:O-antigen ligase family protein [Candidatus Udaeobacter sp.]
MALSIGARPLPRPLRVLGGRLLGALLIIGIGVLIGVQYMAPDKRVLAVMAAVIIAGIAWRLDTLTGLGLLILAIPYPRGTVFGSTNFAFILLLVLIWSLRVTQRLAPRPRGTPVDFAIAGFVAANIVSFYNVVDARTLGLALQNTILFAACLVVFYMIVSNVRTNADLARLHVFQAISIATICLLAVFELNHPGGSFIPGWIEFRNTVGTEFNTRNVRVGGPFFDFELLSEFTALSSLLLTFMILRTRSTYRRVALGLVLLLDIFVLFAAVTRGGIIALTVALAYLLYRVRRRVRIVPLTMIGASVAALAWIMNFYVSHFTRSGNVAARFGETHFIGLVPDDRLLAWKDGWNRFLEHPLIGHGPYYSIRTGTHVWYWPHNGYLYVANLFGLFGLTFYLVLLVLLLRLSSRGGDDLRDPSYSRAFLPIASAQIVLFVVDQVKIDYLRNPIYPFEVWIMCAMLVSAYQIAFPTRAGEPARVPAAA